MITKDLIEHFHRAGLVSDYRCDVALGYIKILTAPIDAANFAFGTNEFMTLVLCAGYESLRMEHPDAAKALLAKAHIDVEEWERAR